MPRSEPVPQYISRTRAAELLDCSPQTVDKLRRQGKLPAVHLGRKVLLDRDELLRRLHAGELQ